MLNLIELQKLFTTLRILLRIIFVKRCWTKNNMKLSFKKHTLSKRNPYQKKLKYLIPFSYSIHSLHAAYVPSICEHITGSLEFFCWIFFFFFDVR